MHYALGIQKDEQLTESAYWFRKSAEQGYPEAEYRLGQAYASGDVVFGVTIARRHVTGTEKQPRVEWPMLSSGSG